MVTGGLILSFSRLGMAPFCVPGGLGRTPQGTVIEASLQHVPFRLAKKYGQFDFIGKEELGMVG
jgi:hypothetical protein